MHSLSFNMRHRPLRIGWCVRAGDLESFRRALRQNFTLWGGNRNVFIVVDDRDEAEQNVRSAYVDVLLSPTDDDPVIKKFIEGFDYLPRVGMLRGSALFDAGPVGNERPLFLDVLTSSRHRAIVARDDPKAEDMQLNVVRWDDDDPLRDVLAMSFGELPRVGEPGAHLQSHIEALHAVTHIDLRGRPELPRDGFALRSIRYLAGRALEEDFWQQRREVSPGYFVGSADNFYDLVNYWNARAAGTSLLFLDPSHANRFEQARAGWHELMVRTIEAPQSPRSYIVVYVQEKHGDVSKIWAPLSAAQYKYKENAYFRNFVPLAYFPERTVLASVGPDRQTLSATLPMPEPPYPLDRHQHRKVALTVRATADVNDDALTFQTPFVPKLNTFYGDRYHWEWFSARVEPRGLAILANLLLPSVGIRAMRVAELVRELFGTRGIRAEPSQAGLVTSRVIAQMGGVDSCRPFRVRGLRALIENTRPEASFTRSEAIQTLREERPDGSVGFEDYRDLYIEPRRSRGPLKPEHVLRYMLTHGAFRVGLEFKCTECELEFWVSLDNARTRMECEYCGKSFDVAPQLRDRDWRYRRSGVFGKKDSQEGSIPVTLTLLRFAHMDPLHRLLYVPAHTLKPKDAAIPECETDFVALYSSGEIGESSVVLAIGECKTRQDITAADVANLVAVADVFEQSGVPTYVVFSKLKEFSADELTLIAKANRRDLVRAIVLTPKELEGWFPYSWAEASTQAARYHGQGFDDFAAATKALYLDSLSINAGSA